MHQSHCFGCFDKEVSPGKALRLKPAARRQKRVVGRTLNAVDFDSFFSFRLPDLDNPVNPGGREDFVPRPKGLNGSGAARRVDEGAGNEALVGDNEIEFVEVS